MRFQTPASIMDFFYFAIDTRAASNIGDEFLAFGVGRFYFGIYPTDNGFEVCWGLTDANGCL